jgi:hypothetical protein
MHNKEIEKNASEIHWHVEQDINDPTPTPSIFEYRNKWYWCDEKGFENGPFDTLEKAKEAQQEYFAKAS